MDSNNSAFSVCSISVMEVAKRTKPRRASRREKKLGRPTFRDGPARWWHGTSANLATVEANLLGRNLVYDLCVDFVPCSHMRIRPNFLRVSLVSLVFSSVRVSLVCLSLRFSAFLLSLYVSLVCSSFRLSRLFVCSSFQSFRLSHLFVSPSSPRKSVATVSVARQLPSPRLGYSRLRI